ncbi:MAG: hypothetical protein JWN10_1667 [Solirubrobacterales bacterium]|nr:hypothetical protein [Solirubrobacterales bacterium]
MTPVGGSNSPRRRSQAQEESVRKAARVSATRRSAAAKRRRDAELREGQERYSNVSKSSYISHEAGRHYGA